MLELEGGGEITKASVITLTFGKSLLLSQKMMPVLKMVGEQTTPRMKKIFRMAVLRN